MNLFHKFTYVIVIFQIFTLNVLSENVTNSNSTDAKDPAYRRSGLLILDDSSKASNGHVTSHKVETKTYTSHVSTSGNAGSGGLQGWVSESQNVGKVVLQPQIDGMILRQQGCRSGDNVLSNTGDVASIIQKKSAIETSQTYTGGGSLNSLTTNENQWQSGQQGLRVPLAVDQIGGQSSILHGSSSRVISNKINDVTRSIITGNNGAVNNIYDAQGEQNIFHPETDYKVSIIASGDGIYANEVRGHQAQNVNVMVPADSPHIVAVPVMRPQLGQVTIHGYRPNIQYYLKQIETSNMIKNPQEILRVPSFIERIRPDQINVNLSEDQLNSYKQYLIQSGLIKLKPYQLIFSDQFRPKLRTLQWMVVPLQSNLEYCKQRCSNIFARNTLYSTLSENASKLPLKLLVPILKVRSGLQKTVTGAGTIVGGVGDISGGMFRMLKDSPSHVTGLLKENPNESKNES